MFMNIDDLITQLQEAKAEYGNLPVRVCTDEVKAEYTSISMINVFDRYDEIDPSQGSGDHVWISLHNS